MGSRGKRRGWQVRRARKLPLGVAAPRALPLPIPWLRGGGAELRRLQFCQRGELPELRGQAAVQVVDAKAPAIGIEGGVKLQRMASATRVLPLGIAAPRALPLPISCRGLQARVPSCGSSQQTQSSELPELRGQAAAQVVLAKLSARGAPERDHEDQRRTQRAARALPLRVAPRLSFLPPISCHGLWRRECRAALAHSSSSGVIFPSCEGKLPLRALFTRFLREQRGGDMGNRDGRRGRQVQRARFPYASPPSSLYPVPHPATAWMRQGGGGGAAHRVANAVSFPSWEGTPPTSLLEVIFLREARARGGVNSSIGQICGRCAACPTLYTTPLFPSRCPYHPCNQVATPSAHPRCSMVAHGGKG